MTHLIKEPNSNHGTALSRPCCHYSHLDATQSDEKIRRLWLALGILSSLSIAELLTGYWSHSLSLLAEAGHLFSDLGSLGLTLIAAWLAERPPSGRATFGHRRVEILAALVNGVSLLVIATLVAMEAVERFYSTSAVAALPMLLIAVASLGCNSVNIALLHRASQNDLNLRGAVLHFCADAASSIGIMLAAIAIYFWNWAGIDAVVSLLIAGAIGLSAISLVWQSLEILLEYAPHTIDPIQVEATLKSFTAVEQVESLHLWTISSAQVILTAHLIVNLPNIEQRDSLLKQIKTHLKQEFGITESTLQLMSSKATSPITLHPLLNTNLINLITKNMEI